MSILHEQEYRVQQNWLQRSELTVRNIFDVIKSAV